ncbi:MAG: helix-turn-helix transcriptional regulator [Oscillospiraceae bacterium]|nr:helix-turn-helix transcriptional regulator [Oscillospiraceae bacterium]
MTDIPDSITITDVTDIITFSSPKGRFRKIDNRPSYGLSFCTEGQITYTLDGKEYISDTSNAVILPQGKSYTLHGDKKGTFPVINFKCTDFLCDEILLFPIENPEPYLTDYEQMKSLSLFKKNRTKIISIFYNILHRLSHSSENSAASLAPAIKYLETNFSDPQLKNDDLAKLCNISEVYFRKLFSKQYGTTPKQFVTDIRIDRAKQLLTDGGLKINAVSDRCGFSNPYHFCRVFRQKTGFTPTEYMRLNKIRKI